MSLLSTALGWMRSSVLHSGVLSSGSSLTSRWRVAVQEHMRRGFAHELPALGEFPGFGVLHRALAEQLQDFRQGLSAKQQERLVYVDADQQLFAACCLRTERVQLRKSAVATFGLDAAPQLVCRLMPSSARLISTHEDSAFSEFSLPCLMWYWGQQSKSAVEYVPDFGDRAIGVYRFPRLPPQALQLRQLRLIHLLGTEPMPFEVLEQYTALEDRPYLCADLASLYATRTLQLH